MSNSAMNSGDGSVRVSTVASTGRAMFSELAYSYPLKLMPPRIPASDAELAPGIQVLYMLQFGGGLVSGDAINLKVEVESACHLVLLTQGSTKIFRELPGGSYRTVEQQALLAASRFRTKQTMHATIAPGSSLFLLPAPVTCFKAASYTQKQVFDLECANTSSLCLLDWFTSGRSARGESWAFDRFRTRNVVRLAGRCVSNDVLLLENTPGQGDVRQRMGQYGCFATLLLLGPACAKLAQHFLKLADHTVQYRLKMPPGLIWSVSDLSPATASSRIVIVRLAGLDTEAVKFWLEEQMMKLRDVIGTDVFKATWA